MPIVLEQKTSVGVISGTTATVSFSSGPSEGNLMVAQITTAIAKTLTPPSGWTEVPASPVVNTVQTNVWFRVAGASEPKNHAWTWIGSSPGTGHGGEWSGTDSSVDISSSASQTNSNPRSGTLNPTGSGDVLIVGCIGVALGTTAFTGLSGGYIALSEVVPIGSQITGHFLEKITTAIASHEAVGTIPASKSWAGINVSFLAAGVGKTIIILEEYD